VACVTKRWGVSMLPLSGAASGVETCRGAGKLQATFTGRDAASNDSLHAQRPLRFYLMPQIHCQSTRAIGRQWPRKASRCMWWRLPPHLQARHSVILCSRILFGYPSAVTIRLTTYLSKGQASHPLRIVVVPILASPRTAHRTRRAG